MGHGRWWVLAWAVALLVGCGPGTSGSSSSGTSGGSGTTASTGSSSSGTSSSGGDVVANGTYTDDVLGGGVMVDVTHSLVTCVDIESGPEPIRSVGFLYALNPLGGGTPTLTDYVGPPGTSAEAVAGGVTIDFNAMPAVQTYTLSMLGNTCIQFTHYYWTDGGSSGSDYYTMQANSAGYTCGGPLAGAPMVGDATLQVTSFSSSGGECTMHGSLMATLDIQGDPSDPGALGTLSVTF